MGRAAPHERAGRQPVLLIQARSPPVYDSVAGWRNGRRRKSLKTRGEKFWKTCDGNRAVIKSSLSARPTGPAVEHHQLLGPVLQHRLVKIRRRLPARYTGGVRHIGTARPKLKRAAWDPSPLIASRLGGIGFVSFSRVREGGDRKLKHAARKERRPGGRRCPPGGVRHFRGGGRCGPGGWGLRSRAAAR